MAEPCSTIERTKRSAGMTLFALKTCCQRKREWPSLPHDIKLALLLLLLFALVAFWFSIGHASSDCWAFYSFALSDVHRRRVTRIMFESSFSTQKVKAKWNIKDNIQNQRKMDWCLFFSVAFLCLLQYQSYLQKKAINETTRDNL